MSSVDDYFGGAGVSQPHQREVLHSAPVEVGAVSPDGQSWWDGANWRSLQALFPDGVPVTSGRVVKRKVVFLRPRRVHRAPEAEAAVWRSRGLAFGGSAIVWFSMAAAGVGAVKLDLAAGVLSSAVVVKALVISRR